jgi:DNA-binding transcriptional regulator/RsmH inhibitor MraZ
MTLNRQAKERKYHKTISIRLSPEEHSRIRERAELSGLSVSAYFRNVVMENRTSITAVTHTSDELKFLLYVSNRILKKLEQFENDLQGVSGSDEAIAALEMLLNQLIVEVSSDNKG